MVNYNDIGNICLISAAALSGAAAALSDVKLAAVIIAVGAALKAVGSYIQEQKWKAEA